MKEKCEEEIKNSKDINIVLLGRPYTVLSKTMNNGIPDLFARHKIKTYFQNMIRYTEDEVKDVEPLLTAFHWHFASTIIATASKIAKTDGLYPVLVTSFKCSPDSFVIEYFKTIMDAHNKPYLILQLDDHNSNVGYETRIEAAVRSFRNHNMVCDETIKFNAESIVPIVAKSPGLLAGKTLLFPSFDPISCKFIVGVFKTGRY